MVAQACASKVRMARTYTLRKRAESQAETRQRIVEAAVELHRTRGPAHTTMSQVAERAGVQRHTLYAHFPDERSLHLACSGLLFGRDPLPDAKAWTAIPDPRERLRAGIRELYSWYERNADIAGCVLRDREHHAITQEMAALRFVPPMTAIVRVLGEGLDAERSALLRLALSYHTWRTLAHDGGLGPDGAAEVMARAILAPA
jgi:AcrR family transcriptional regulator